MKTLSENIITIANSNINLIVNILENYKILNPANRPFLSQQSNVSSFNNIDFITSEDVNNYSSNFFTINIDSIINSIYTHPNHISIINQINFIVDNNTFNFINHTNSTSIPKNINNYLIKLASLASDFNINKSLLIKAINNYPKFNALEQKSISISSNYNKIINSFINNCPDNPNIYLDKFNLPLTLK